MSKTRRVRNVLKSWGLVKALPGIQRGGAQEGLGLLRRGIWVGGDGRVGEGRGKGQKRKRGTRMYVRRERSSRN